KKELIGRAVIAGVAELNCPELVNFDCLSSHIAQYAEKRARIGIEGINSSLGNVVSHQQRATERAKIRGRHGQSPGRMQWTIDGHMFEQVAVSIKFVDKAAG